MTREFVTFDAIILAFGVIEHGNKNLISTYVHRVRVVLRKEFGVEIHTLWGRGWYLDPQDKEKLRHLLEPRLQVAA